MVNWLLTLSDVTVVRGDTEILTGITLKARSGNTVRITGANGSGKTSLLRLIAGIDRLAAHRGASRGRIELSHNQQAVERAWAVNWIGHDNALKNHTTARQYLAAWQHMLGANNHQQHNQRLHHALQRWSLTRIADAPAAYLSRGQQRRVALARLSAIPRPLWLLDEPEASLDAQGHAILQQEMLKHESSGGITLYASHGDTLPKSATIDLAAYAPR